MPRRSDLSSILVIGAGPIMIGQACEFDYSGVQAIKALREDGYKVILVNSNPATIMTDPDLADATYIEPLTPYFLEKIIAAERPCALLATMGGQTALNLAVTLDDTGILRQYDVELIGASRSAIETAESREQFRQAMHDIGLRCVRGEEVSNVSDSLAVARTIGFPVILRPSFTLGGYGGGIAHNEDELKTQTQAAIAASPVGSVIVEQSIVGWKEFEMEVVRDKKDNCIIVCSIENVDPMGVHTGDSITVAPALTLTDKEYQIMREASIAVLRKIGVETGGSNVQFAVNPADGQLLVIEANPRVSRSSALASKATGFPIARVAAKLAVGYHLDEIANDITGGITPASFEPTLDYIVTKIPRFSFEKFPESSPLLGTSMKSVGEVMAIGRSFAESLQKALRAINSKATGLDCPTYARTMDDEALLTALAITHPQRLLLIAEALRRKLGIERIQKQSHYDSWFLHELEKILAREHQLQKDGLPHNAHQWSQLKAMGFCDARIAHLTKQSLATVHDEQKKAQLQGPIYKRIDSCSSEFPSTTAYMYGTWHDHAFSHNAAASCESDPPPCRKVMIVGSGANRIGQGIEFDYCCVHAAFALKEKEICSIMVNCNPETVSTDYDISDRLYFEPLTAEDVIAIARKEQSRGDLLGVITQFGGQTPLRLSHALHEAGIPLLGTPLSSIDTSEDRQLFSRLVSQLHLKQPRNATANSADEAVSHARTIGFPVILRPSYVLGGRAMQIVYNESMLEQYIQKADAISKQSPLLIDSFLHDAIEVDVDSLADSKGNVYIAGIMEHIEEAGIHSGDSACWLPPRSLAPQIINQLERHTIALAQKLKVCGLLNVQYAIRGDEIFIIEANPRASRTVPFIAKASRLPLVSIATQLMLGATLPQFNLHDSWWNKANHVAVKEAVFPFHRFPGSDPLLGPEMKSTGEVMGIDSHFPYAFAKSQLAAGATIPEKGTVFISVRDNDKKEMTKVIAQQLQDTGFTIAATKGTAQWLEKHDIETTPIRKVKEGSPNSLDYIAKNQFQLIINTSDGEQAKKDSLTLRRMALTCSIPYCTTITGACAMMETIVALKSHSLDVKPLQKYFDTAIVS